jgi:hypothetical protein
MLRNGEISGVFHSLANFAVFPTDFARGENFEDIACTIVIDTGKGHYFNVDNVRNDSIGACGNGETRHHPRSMGN